MKESGTVNRWTELNRKEKPTLIKNPFSLIDDHILASDVGPRFINSIFIPFITLFICQYEKEITSVLSQNRLALRTSFHTNTTVKCEQDLYFAMDC